MMTQHLPFVARLACAAVLISAATLGHTETGTPRIHSANGDSSTVVQWTPHEIVLTPSAKPGISAKTFVGEPSEPGLYLVRVRMEPSTVNAAHVHPDARVTTVLSGTVYYGIGNVVDRSSAKAFGPGSVYFTPSNTPHWLVTGDEPAVYEEAGVGPSKSTPLPSAAR